MHNHKMIIKLDLTDEVMWRDSYAARPLVQVVRNVMHLFINFVFHSPLDGLWTRVKQWNPAWFKFGTFFQTMASEELSQHLDEAETDINTNYKAD